MNEANTIGIKAKAIMSKAGTVALYLITFCAVQATVGLAAQLAMSHWMPEVPFQSSPAALTAVSASCSALLLALFVGLKWCPVSRNYVRSRPWGTLLWTVPLSVGIIIPLTFISECLPESWQTDLLGGQMADMLKTTEGYFAVCMLAPLMEEVVFRGAMIRAMMGGRASRPWLAIVISAALFALVHMNPAQMPHAFMVGLLLGWLFVRTGSIVPGVILHWINNSTAYLMLNLFPLIPYDAKLAAYFGGSQAAVYQAVIFSLLIALPALYQLRSIFSR